MLPRRAARLGLYGTHLLAAYVAVAVVAAALPEFETLRVNGTVHGPFVLGLFLAAALATLAAWRHLVRDPRSVTVLTFLAFASLAGIYSPHALLESGAPDPAHLVFGPVSRAAFGFLLLAALAGVRVPERLRDPRYAVGMAAVIVVVADLVLHAGGVVDAITRNPRSVLRTIEAAALVAELAALAAVVVRRRREDGLFLGALARALVAMSVSSGLFLLSAPWETRWWVAHLGLLVAATVITMTLLAERQRTGELSAVVAVDALSSIADLLIRELDSGLALIDERDTVVSWSPRAAELTGWTRDEANALLPRGATGAVLRLGDADVRVRTSWLDKPRPLQVVLLDDAAHVVELREENRRLDRMAAALERASTEKDHLLGMVSHELRGPIGTLRGMAETLAARSSDQLDETGRYLVERVVAGSDRLLLLVDDLLEFASSDDGAIALTLDVGPCDLVPVAREVVEGFESHASAKQIRVELSAPGGAANAMADADRMRQVLHNLVSNAVKFSPADTTVRVLVEEVDDQVVLAVTDEGPGIPEDEQHALFTPFSRISVRPTGGESSTGLGLTIVERIVRAHGAGLQLDSAPGRGSTFRVLLPAVDSTVVLDPADASAT